MIITMESITPAKAEQWLTKNNKANRALRAGVAEKYAADMRAGRWTNCPEPISFYEDNELADGQHRLWAIVESGVTVKMPIARGLKREDGLNLNTGLGRTLIDNARISGADKDLTPALLSAAKAIATGTIQGKAMSNAERLAVVDKFREPAMFAASNVRRKQGLCGANIMAAVGRAWLHEKDHDRLRRFCDVFATGLYDGDGETAAIALRNYVLTKGPMASSTAMWRDTFMKAQNAIKYFMLAKRLTVCKVVAEEAYPLPAEKKARKPA